MSLMHPQPRGLSNNERGSIIIMTAIAMVCLFLVVGLCIDVSRIYMVRAEGQNAADAAALTAARELNSGGSGIDNAVARAKSIVNTQGFAKAGVTIATVGFAANLNDAYIPAYNSSDPSVTTAAARNQAATIRFVKVTTQTTTTTIFFALSALGPAHAEARQAVAGMSVSINTICDFFPVTVALANPSPAPNTTMTLTFVQGNPGANTLADKNYILVDVPEISGNGEKETVLLAAGVTSICETLNVNVPFHITPSANKNNGPKAIGWGANSRFDNPGKNYVDPSTYPPDTNIKENITFDQYINRTPGYSTAPSHPGKDERRIVIAPIVLPGTYQASPGAPIKKFGAFFLKSQIPPSATLNVEWIDETLVIGRGGFTPGGGNSSLTLPVLYQ